MNSLLLMKYQLEFDTLIFIYSTLWQDKNILNTHNTKGPEALTLCLDTCVWTCDVQVQVSMGWDWWRLIFLSSVLVSSDWRTEVWTVRQVACRNFVGMAGSVSVNHSHVWSGGRLQMSSPCIPLLQRSWIPQILLESKIGFNEIHVHRTWQKLRNL